MSHADKNNGTPFPADDAALDAVVQRVLRVTGRVVPETEEEVAHAELAMTELEIKLPVELQKPPTGPVSSPHPPQLPLNENLARAARNGGEIPPEILSYMKEDREKAEAKKGPHE